LDKITKEEFLDFWEKRHKKLTPKWREAFLLDPLLDSIIEHDSDLIFEVTREFRKLIWIADELSRRKSYSDRLNLPPQPLDLLKETLSYCPSCGAQVTQFEAACNC
jgi:hypothetical protein